jgi:mono/diheme cytochrome c family protein
MISHLPNKIFAVLTTLVCFAFAFPTPPPFPPDLGEDDGNQSVPMDPSAEVPDRSTTSPNLPSNGKEYYLKECAICHGPGGDGTERGTPLHKPYKVYATHITRHGRNGDPKYAIPMPAYPREILPDRLLVQIWSYLEGASAPTSGEDIYRVYCANCHGKDGRGGMTGQPLITFDRMVTSPEIFALWVRWGQDDGYYDSRGSYMPRWNQDEISESDLAKLRVYIQSLSSLTERRYVP